MTYHNIPEEVLNIELGEYFSESGLRNVTLQEELDTIGEEVIHSEYHLGEDSLGYPTIETFIAWTENHVVQVIEDSFNTQTLIALPRNPI